MSEIAPGKRQMPLRNRLLRILGIPALVAVVLAIAIPSVTTRMETREVCRACGAWRETTSRGIGRDFNPGMYRDEVTISPSTVLEEVYGGKHAHTWSGCGATKYFLGLKTGVACGDSLPNPLALAYDRDEAFREAIRVRLAAGDLKREELITFLDVPDLRRRFPPGLEAKTPEFRDRLRRAHALVTEVGIPKDMRFTFSGWEAELK